MADIKEIMI